MRSNLALLDEAVSTAIAHELGEPVRHENASVTISPERRRSVAGLNVVSNAARDAAADKDAAKLFRSLSNFRVDEKIIREKLLRVGVTPIAVLPLTAWNRLCDRTKLHRFTPSSAGEVRISTKLLEDVKREVDAEGHTTPSPLWSFLVPPSTIGLAVYLSNHGASDDVVGRMFLFGTLFGTIGVGLMLSSLRESSNTQLVERKLKEKIEAAIADKTIDTLLWPEWIEPEQGRNPAVIRIALPDPPADVQETLVAAERLGITMRVAVVGDAIHLKDDPLEAMMRRYRSERDAKATGWAALLDPIVYVTEGNAAAIIAQYGDFPIEKEVINEVINSVHLA